MDMTMPYTALLAKTEGKVLAVLAGTTRPLSGREVARLAGLSQNGAWRVLRRLVEHGVVSQQEAGSGAALLYSLNHDHLAAEPVIALLRLREMLFDRIKGQIEAWPLAPVHASIFGSAARGDGDTASDIDVFVVRPQQIDDGDDAWRSQLDDLSERIRAWSGNHAGVAEIGEPELRRLRRDRPRVVGALREDAIVLAGLSIEELFGTRR